MTSRIARKKEITIEPIFWHYFVNQDGNSPIKLKVTHDRKTKNYPVQFKGKNLFISKAKWLAISEGKVRTENRELLDHIHVLKVSAIEASQKITQGGRPFSFAQFEKAFFAKESSSGFLAEFDSYLKKLLNEERIGTHRTYKSAYDAFKAYLGDIDISPYNITSELLNSFQGYLLNGRVKKGSLPERTRKAGKTTVGFYMRTLRVIYNNCAFTDPGLRQYYPFGNEKRGKFRIPDSKKGGKKGDALTLEQLKKFRNLEIDPDSPSYEARMYWLFSFYCQGMNFRDICYLTNSNVQEQAIKYTRQKTKRTEDQEIIEVPLTDSMREIISTLGTKSKLSNSYVFPILTKHISDPLKMEAVILQKIKITNKWLKAICEVNDLPAVTTYWARHTYASLLKFSGVPIEEIRELLGHSDLKTTEHYLKRFDLDRKRAINQKLNDSLN